MAQKILTSSCEAATLSIANGGNSDIKLLKNRDRRVKGINVDSASSSTVQLTITFSGTTNVNVIGLGGVTTSANTAIEFYYSSTLDGSITATTFSNNDIWHEFSATRSDTVFKVYFNPSISAEVYCGCVFLGVSYDFTNNYDYNNTRNSFMRHSKITDDYGYPYSYLLHQDKKFNFDLTWGMGKSDLGDLEDALVDSGYGAKPYFYYDSNIAGEKSGLFNTCYLVTMPDSSSFDAYQPGADYFKVRMNMVQL